MTTTTGGRGDREELARIISEAQDSSVPWPIEIDYAAADAILAEGFGRPPAPCIGGNTSCPCQDGDPCHYKDYGNTKAFPIPAHATDKPSGLHEVTGAINHWYQCDHCGNASRECFSVCDACGKMECMRVEARPVRPASLCPPPPQQQTGRDGGGEI